MSSAMYYLALACLLTPNARAQEPTVVIHDRTVADVGPPTGEVFEPALAMTRAIRLEASTCFNPNSLPMRHAYGSNQSSSWLAGSYSMNGRADPTIAVIDSTPNANRFVVFSLLLPHMGSPALGYSVYTPGGSPEFSDWKTAYVGTPDDVDKPWVIRRSANDFFVFFYRGAFGFSYLRTADGANWGDLSTPLSRYDVATDIPGQVTATFCCQPSVGADGNVYVAHATGIYGAENGKIRILKGTDPEGDNSGPLSFVYLKTAGGSPAEVAPRHPQNSDLPVPTANGFDLGSRTVPYLVSDPTSSDPTSSDRHFVVYQDSANGNTGNMNVYLARFVRAGGSWTATTSTVHDDPDDDPNLPGCGASCPDQFIPTMAIDSKGWIHITYYDNRPTTGRLSNSLSVIRFT
jgi:hypothetical protein